MRSEHIGSLMQLFVDDIGTIMIDVPSWVWYLEAAKLAALFGSRFVLGLSWGVSILITLIVVVAGIVWRVIG